MNIKEMINYRFENDLKLILGAHRPAKMQNATRKVENATHALKKCKMPLTKEEESD